VPGSRITAEHSDGTYTVTVDGSGTVLDLGEDLALHLFVATA
jgi:DtxR family transcriptional regulator, Mn-dependent transcriptional regulator